MQAAFDTGAADTSGQQQEESASMADAAPDGHLDLLRQGAALAQLGELALRSDDLDEILTKACRMAGEALGTGLAAIMALREDGGSLLVRAGVGWASGVVGEATVAATGDRAEGHVLGTREPTISPDIDQETRFGYPPFVAGNGVKAVADLAIAGGQDRPPFGILRIGSRTPREFTEGDTAFLRGYASLLAAAVDRLRVAGERRDGETRLRLALDAAEMGSWDLDLTTSRTSRTPRHDQIFGYADPLPEWHLATFLDHVVKEDRRAAEAAFLEAMTDGGLGFECRINRADGEVRWIAVKGRTSFADDGTTGRPTPVRMIGVIRDVTDSRQAQQLLRELNDRLEERVGEGSRALAGANSQLMREIDARKRGEERFAAAFLLAPVPMVVSLAEDFRILDVNEAFVRTLGYAAADAVGRTADDLKLWDRSAARRQMEREIEATGRVRNLDVVLTTKTGWLLDCLASAEIVTIEGRRCVLSVFQDITERKRSEAELFEAIEAVMRDTSWFSRTVIEKLAQLRHPERSKEAKADLADLTPREQEVLGLLCQGRNAEEMAASLGLSRNTVRNHLAALYQKIGAHGRSEAIIWARERGFTGPTAQSRVR